MTAYGFGTSVSGSGVQASLNADGDLAFVLAGVLVTSTDDDAIKGTASNLYVHVQGIVMGAHAGISLGDSATKDINQFIEIEAGGGVYGKFFGLAAAGNGSTIVNKGHVYGSDYGAFMDGNKTSTTSMLTNSGTIESGAGGFAVSTGGSEHTVIVNSGTITGSYSFFDLGKSANVIANTGTMTSTYVLGGIHLGDGDDVYSGKAGHAIGGTIDGGSGDDTILAGSEANRISGGNGNDVLFGGQGNDIFIFSDAPSNGTTNHDRIKDFSNAKGNDDHVELDHNDFKALTIGGLSPASFKDLSVKGATEDGDDRILYKHATGDLFYDANGSDAGGIVQIAHLDNHALLTHHDFFVV